MLTGCGPGILGAEGGGAILQHRRWSVAAAGVVVAVCSVAGVVQARPCGDTGSESLAEATAPLLPAREGELGYAPLTPEVSSALGLLTALQDCDGVVDGRAHYYLALGKAWVGQLKEAGDLLSALTTFGQSDLERTQAAELRLRVDAALWIRTEEVRAGLEPGPETATETAAGSDAEAVHAVEPEPEPPPPMARREPKEAPRRAAAVMLVGVGGGVGAFGFAMSGASYQQGMALYPSLEADAQGWWDGRDEYLALQDRERLGLALGGAGASALVAGIVGAIVDAAVRKKAEAGARSRRASADGGGE